MKDIDKLISDLAGGNRRSLAKAITLIESTRTDQREAAGHLLAEIMPMTGRSLRLGISGIPGVGKSTFIEAFGKHLLAEGHRLAILAIDPSSPITGGSIMGDRTRMEELSAHDDVFIRPSPSGGTLGGIARHTAEVLLACEAAGYDIVIIETMGVGQSEVAVASLVDVFLMLQMPGTGDELQGIKKGILELADLIAVTKADGPTKKGAERARHELEHALSLVRSREAWSPPVLLCSSLEGTGIREVWKTITDFTAHQQKTHEFDRRRLDQRSRWFTGEVVELISEHIFNSGKFSKDVARLEKQVTEGQLPATVAAARLVDKVFG